MQAQIPRANLIQFLVGRKFPHQRHWNSFRLKMIPPETRPAELVESLIDAYEEELSEKTPAEIDELVKAEEEAERLEFEEFEARQWFNAPEARADFDYWSKMGYWTLGEAVALTLGRSPEKLNPERLKRQTPPFKFALEYDRRMELVERADAVGLLAERCRPEQFLAWAKRVELSYPLELEVILSRKAGPTVDWKARYETEAATLAACKAELEQVRALLAAKDAKPLGQRERESLLKLVIGVVIDAYGYDPHASRSPVTREISDILARRGIALDEDTVRKYLQEAKELLPPPETEQDR
jgi:hypothetical protein